VTRNRNHNVVLCYERSLQDIEGENPDRTSLGTTGAGFSLFGCRSVFFRPWPFVLPSSPEPNEPLLFSAAATAADNFSSANQGGLAQQLAGVSLKPKEEVARPAPVADSRSDLLSAIRVGKSGVASELAFATCVTLPFKMCISNVI